MQSALVHGHWPNGIRKDDPRVVEQRQITFSNFSDLNDTLMPLFIPATIIHNNDPHLCWGSFELFPSIRHPPAFIVSLFSQQFCLCLVLLFLRKKPKAHLSRSYFMQRLTLRKSGNECSSQSCKQTPHKLVISQGGAQTCC